jgi:hypothetical protein
MQDVVPSYSGPLINLPLPTVKLTAYFMRPPWFLALNKKVSQKMFVFYEDLLPEKI